MRSLLSFEIKERDNFYFIIYKNIGNIDNMINNKTVNINTTLISKSLAEMAIKRGDTIPSKQIKLFPRGVIKRISDIITMYPNKFTSDIKQATLQHLYFRYLLNIGDSGTQNILYREDNSNQLVVGIDMEEIRGKDQGHTKLEYLFNSRYNKKVALFKDMIDNVVYLYDKGWTKEELKSFIDKYCLESENELLTMIQDNKKSESVTKLDGIINSYRP